MAGSNSNDPTAVWRDMMAQWEKGVNALATQTMGTSEFSRDVNRVMGVSLRMQKSMQDMFSRYFDALNIPTKDDLKGLGERLHAIEEQIGRMTVMLERLGETGDTASNASPRVSRTRRFRGEEASKS